MARSVAAALLSVVALTSVPGSLASGGTIITNSADFSSLIVKLHNSERALHFKGTTTTKNVTWSTTLAAGAQSWASMCKFEHSLGCSGTGCNPPGTYGENLFSSDPLASQDVAAQMAMESWYNEVTSYNFATPGFNPNAGHFTQVVWSDSVQVGCGAANCGGVPLILPTYVVCRYSPAGNYDTSAEFAANVLPCDGTCKTVSYVAGSMLGRRSLQETAVQTKNGEGVRYMVSASSAAGSSAADIVA